MGTWVDQLSQDKVDDWLHRNGEQACTEYHTTDPRFALWMYYVDRRVRQVIHFGCMDLEDWPYYDAYEDGVSPREAATDVITDSGFGVGFE